MSLRTELHSNQCSNIAGLERWRPVRFSRSLVGTTTFQLNEGRSLNFALPGEWLRDFLTLSTSATSSQDANDEGHAQNSCDFQSKSTPGAKTVKSGREFPDLDWQQAVIFHPGGTYILYAHSLVLLLDIRGSGNIRILLPPQTL
jgi:hypothetical protein